MAEFISDIESTPWHNIENLSTVDEMVHELNTAIFNIFDKHAPIITKRLTKRHPVPWMTPEIRRLMAQRDCLFRKARRSQNPNQMNQYRHLRNRVKQFLRNSKLRYIRKLFENNKQSSKVLWKNVKGLGLGKQTDPQPIHIPLDELNRYFSSCSQNINQHHINNYINELVNLPIQFLGYPEFNFKPVTQYDVLRAIRRIRSNASGIDGISIRLIKDILFAILPIITYIFNSSLSQYSFPSLWKSALIRPFNKISAPVACQDFRPISILPALSKGLERIVHCQITEFINDHGILSDYQSGFRSSHSTETALLRVSEDIRLAMERRQGTILTLFDFSKAFDCVNHNLLIEKLRAIGFSENVLKWLRSYLSDRRQCVEVDNIRSDWETVTSGVPQGSILGPLLFVLYVNDIHSALTHCKYHMYADDLQIYAHFTVGDINNCVTRINEDVARIITWTEKHGLRLNHNKTKPMIICHPRLRNKIDFDVTNPITVDGHDLPYYDKVKNLGLTINSTFTWGDAVVDIRKKIFASIHSLKHLQNFLPLHIKLQLVKSLVMPHFTYCNSVINDMTVSLAGMLQRSQNYCLRYVYDLRRQEHITTFYLESKILKLNDQRSIKILSLVFSIIKNRNPKYFINDFNFVAQDSLRTSRSSSFILRIPMHRTTVYDRAFVVTACRLWNELPTSIKSIESCPRFVAALKKLYFERMALAGAF